MVSTDIGIWVGALLTLCILSYFTSGKQNVAFRFAQSTVLGISIGYIIVLVFVKQLNSLAISKIATGNIIYIIPIILGLLMYSKFVPQYRYLARIPIAWVVALGLGLGARGTLQSNILIQIMSTAKLPIVGVDLFTSFSNIVYIISLVSTIVFFFFTLNPKMQQTLKPVSTLGRYFLMVFFGITFGSTFMSRVTLIVGVVSMLLQKWLGL
jgi:hypothetical protein